MPGTRTCCGSASTGAPASDRASVLACRAGGTCLGQEQVRADQEERGAYQRAVDRDVDVDLPSSCRPDEGCDCRKPRPGMIFAARERYGLDLSSAVMVGDSVKDILAGKAAGCGRTVLVKTGNGKTALKSLEETGQSPDHVAADLNRAVAWILERGNYSTI